MSLLPKLDLGAKASLAPVLSQAAAILRPVERMSPSQAAERYVRLRQPTGGVEPFSLARTPYLREVLDATARRDVSEVVLLGPAQDTGKTSALIGLSLGYVGLVAQVDCRIIQMSMDAAGDFSRKKIDPAIRSSPAVKIALGARSSDDNTYEKRFAAGHFLNVGWPAPTQLASHSTPFMALTDYDRMPPDVGGEGSVYAQAKGRIGSDGRGVLFAESTPKFDCLDPAWKRAPGSHALPPAGGIVTLYNAGDQRRWWWPCPHEACGEYFEASFEDLYFPDEGSPAERADKAVLICPCCGQGIGFEQRAAMNARGVWVPEGCHVDADGGLQGDARVTNGIRSYHVSGLAASALSGTWARLVRERLEAESQFETSDDDGKVKEWFNLRMALPHLPRVLARHKARAASDIEQRCEPLPKRKVPEGVRCLVAAIDINDGDKPWFDVLIAGYGVDSECWWIDRFPIREAQSKRGDEPQIFRRGPDGRAAPVAPASYLEDWQALIPAVLDRSYPLADGSGRRMKVSLAVCDMHGADGVSANATEFARGLWGGAHQNTLVLARGDGTNKVKRYELTRPDSSQRSNRKGATRGDLVIARFNTNQFKDTLHAALGRSEPGPGYIHIPAWWAKEKRFVFDELTAETRDEKGAWVKASGRRNEAIDLANMARLAWEIRGGTAEDWQAPARAGHLPWDQNSLVFDPQTAAQASSKISDLLP